MMPKHDHAKLCAVEIEGNVAARAGKPAEANPYQPGFLEAEAWRLGWNTEAGSWVRRLLARATLRLEPPWWRGR